MITQRIVSTLDPLVAGRVYALVLPDDADDRIFPCLRFNHTAITEEDFVDAGQLLQRYRLTFDVFSKTYDECWTLRGQVVTALRAMPEFMEQILDFDTYEPDTKLFRWVLDFSFRDC
jgi:hypothetical protein